MEVVTPEEVAGDLDDPMPERYREFRDREGIPVHMWLCVDDVTEVETGPWDRTGQRGAFVNLYGMQGIDDVQIHEIAPGGEMDPQRHFYEEIVWVVQGNGLSVIGEGDDLGELDERGAWVASSHTMEVRA